MVPIRYLWPGADPVSSCIPGPALPPPSPMAGQQRPDHVAEVGCGKGLVDPEPFGLAVGAAVSPEKKIHERRKVGIIAGVAVTVVVPVVQLRGADEQAQRADGKTDVGVDVNRPDAPEGDEAGEGF